MSAPIVGRLAPSPTGDLHLGHARSFLLAWWHARARGGRIVLRMEDLDGDRARLEFIDQTLHDLEWLGLDWDGPWRLQSEGLPRLRALAEALTSNGQAYPCVCTRGEIRAASAPQEGALEVRYPGTCRSRFDSTAAARAASGRDPGLRFFVRQGAVEFRDQLRGAQVRDVSNECGDFLIQRRDGTPAYQLAVVADDVFDGVTEVVRGDDLLDSTARQVLLLEALEQPLPDYFHVPLVRDHTGRRLAKRERALGLRHFREAAVDPRAIVTWVAKSTGVFDAGELASADEFVRDFDLRRVSADSVVLGDDPLSQLRARRLR